MDREAAAIKYANWEKLIIAANSTDLNKKEWCAQNGINEKTFYYWQRKVRQKAAETMNALKVATQSSPMPVAKDGTIVTSHVQNSFVELQYRNEETAFSPAACETEPGNEDPELVLQVRDCRLFIRGNVQEHTLAVVLKAVRNA